MEDGSRSQHKDMRVICRLNTASYVLYRKSRNVFDCTQCHIAVVLSSELAGYCAVGCKGTWRHSLPAMSLLYTDSHQVGLRTVRDKNNTMEVKASGRACTGQGLLSLPTPLPFILNSVHSERKKKKDDINNKIFYYTSENVSLILHKL